MNMLCFSSRFIHTRFSNHCVKVCARLCYETICRDLCFYLFGTFLCFVCLFETGALNDCFLSNICSEKQKLPIFLYSLRKAKKF